MDAVWVPAHCLDQQTYCTAQQRFMFLHCKGSAGQLDFLHGNFVWHVGTASDSVHGSMCVLTRLRSVTCVLLGVTHMPVI